MTLRRLLWAATLALLAGCDNGGATRTLGITATGVIRGEVWFDANGSGLRDAGDAEISGATVRILAPAGADTIRRDTTRADGSFAFADVPVGTWVVELDSASVGDSALVLAGRRATITVSPADTVAFVGALSYPVRTIAEARALPSGVRVFVRAVALHPRAAFSDTALHVIDATGAMRAVRVRPSTAAVSTGDSLVLNARVTTRLGQRVLDDVGLFVVGPTLVPTAPLLTTVVAATGGAAGSLDAALVRAADALVTDTATVGGDLTMTVTDGSGALVVVLDRAADPGFRAPFPANTYVPGSRFDLLGILVPTGTGIWRLKPRSVLDLVRR